MKAFLTTALVVAMLGTYAFGGESKPGEGAGDNPCVDLFKKNVPEVINRGDDVNYAAAVRILCHLGPGRIVEYLPAGSEALPDLPPTSLAEAKAKLPPGVSIDVGHKDGSDPSVLFEGVSIDIDPDKIVITWRSAIPGDFATISVANNANSTRGPSVVTDWLCISAYEFGRTCTYANLTIRAPR